MNKGGVIVLIIAAIVFTGLGFVIGNVVIAAGNNPGSEKDPVMTQSLVEQLVSVRVGELEQQIADLEAQISSLMGGGAVHGQNNNGDDNNGNGTDTNEPSRVKVTADSVNVRASASTSANIVASVTSGTELTYLGSTTASDGTWYQVRLSDGAEGYIASWLCGEPY